MNALRREWLGQRVGRLVWAMLLGLWVVWGMGGGAMRGVGATNTFRWVSAAGGALDEVGRAVARDPNGEAVVVGSFLGTMIAGTTSLTNSGDSDVFVARVGTNGLVTSAWRAGGRSEDAAFAVAVDTQRNILVAGVFRNAITFGSIQLTGAGSTLEIFLVKYAPDGTVIWAQRAGGEGDDRVESVALDPDGGIYITGSFQGAATFGTGTSLTAAFIDTFVARYQPDGVLSWVKKVSASNGALGRGIAYGGDGRLMVTGRFLGTLTAGTNTLSSTGDSDVYLARMTRGGEVMWVRKAGGGVGDSGVAVAYDGTGGWYVGGYFAGTAAFDAIAVGAAGGRDAFVAHYQDSGVVDWVRKGGGTLDDGVNALSVDVQGNVYVAGQFINAARFEPVSLGDTTRGTEAYLARYGLGGSLDWIASAGSETSVDVANGVVAGGRGDVFVTGSFRSSASFGTNMVTAVGGSDLFVAARVKEVPVVVSGPTNVVVLGGSNAVFSVTAAGGGPLTYQWEKDGVAIAGETNSVLVLTGVTMANAGVYRVEVGNPDGVIFSEGATLQVEYLVTVLKLGEGQVFVDPLLESYAGGSTVELLGVPAAGSFFGRWQGGLDSTENPVSMVVTGHTTVTVVFGNTALDVGVASGSGRVTRTPSKDRYERGDTVILSAIPGNYFEFVAWDDGHRGNPRVITIGAVNRYYAQFTNTVELETLEFGGVTRVAPVGLPALLVDEKFETGASVLRGETALIRLYTSFPNGAIFYSLDGSEPTEVYEKPFQIQASVRLRVVALSADFTIRRELEPVEIQVLETYQLTKAVRGGGVLVVDPVKALYLSQDVVKLTAVPAQGWEFLGWNGDMEPGAGTNTSVVMDRNRCVEPVFGTRLTAAAVGAGKVQVEPLLSLYPYGSVVRLTAVPEAGTNFALWGGAVSSSQNPVALVVTNPTPSVSAAFVSLAANQFSLVVRAVGLGSVSVLPRQNRYTNGQVIALVPKPDAGQGFVQWSNGATGSANPLVVTIQQSTVIDAVFTAYPLLSWTNCSPTRSRPDWRLAIQAAPGARLAMQHANLSSGAGWVTWRTVTNVGMGSVVELPGEATLSSEFYRVDWLTNP